MAKINKYWGQDQLLSDENFELRDGDHKINLTL